MHHQGDEGDQGDQGDLDGDGSDGVRPATDLDGGHLGAWGCDHDDQPAFHVRTAVPAAALVLPEGGLGACWHQVANRRITALASVDGGLAVWTARRGVVRLTDGRRAWDVDGLQPETIAATWGAGWAEWSARAAGGAAVRRRVSVVDGERPALRIDVEIDVPAGGIGPRWIHEGLALAPRPLLVGALMSRRTPAPRGYAGVDRLAWTTLFAAAAAVRASTDGVRRVLGRRLLGAVEVDPGGRSLVVRARRRPGRDAPATQAWFDPALPDLVLAGLAGAPGATLAVHADGPPGPGLRVQGADGSTVAGATFALVLARDDVERDDAVAAVEATPPSSSARWWTDRLRLTVDPSPSLSPSPSPAPVGRASDDPATGDPRHPDDDSPSPAGRSGDGEDLPPVASLAREATWHAAQLVGRQQRDDWFGASYPAQGSAYGYVHGLQGAPRDYAISSLPLAFADPAGARDALVVMARMTRRSGSVAYAHTGRGRTTSGGIHAAPTDLPIFWLWALTEYVWATGDRALLDEPIPFDPPAAGAATPRQRVALAHRYLVERIGTGPHGLVRVGSGDWADPISAMVADRRAFHEHGESGFNTAFAVHVLPRAAELVAHDDPALAAELRATADRLRRAMEATWNGSWFLRGFDGRGGPVGNRHLFLDGQVWCLIAGIGTDDQRTRLVEAIVDRCLRPSPIGATILDRPHPVRAGMLAPGWDCNGGVWAAVNGLLAWGLAEHDIDLAWACLRAQSLAAHARAYPHVWYGIWSGPDAYNAHFGSRPGETFVQPATPMAEFPVMNSNAHAGPLLGLLGVLGLQAGPAGVSVAERPGGPAWHLTCPLGTWSGGG
ncbi:MAG: hypothetical protein U0Q07_13445 [Acidimicrobiales bacterium]